MEKLVNRVKLKMFGSMIQDEPRKLTLPNFFTRVKTYDFIKGFNSAAQQFVQKTETDRWNPILCI